jgi:hypothetical protein
MDKRSKNFAKLFDFQKCVGIFCIAIGIPIFLLDTNKGSEVLLLVGLFTLFTASQKLEDERSVSLKTSSLYISFILAYVFKILSSNLYSHHLFPIEMTAINHFMILVFSLSLVIYYFRFYSFR